MALTPAEKQENYRKRKASDARAEGFATEADVLKMPFSEWLDPQYWEDVTNDLDYIGTREIIEFPGADDTDPFWREEWGEGPHRGSIGCAQRMVGVFMDAAVELASVIQKYKLEQVNARIAEIEAADLTDPVIKKKALADIARFTKYRDHFSKKVRWSLPQWEARDV